ncbi:uncharacterized protein FOMMEDRAFT_114187 [Fomitiporia mediterranea MF3/22]|uniref:uncharacterized protein n=1 Tax=Fomitiporia mediterranea (strain MF3/22) TaxID=694068 RepID=UPI0004407AF9|nr:uncharacterized protein FOMMEDRAFT_114187 [Fomitiporia mediterranea MF3/22]EJC98420.1 hypothetical protein FOMMEDRAFT_114187 [Fomitiporia mediterranea MF3/22]
MRSDPELWSELQTYGWIPRQAKAHPEHEPRNGLYMCIHHHRAFDAYRFFIRFYPDIRKFVFVNYSEDAFLRQYHGKAIALDVGDRYAPFPSLFIVHEMRVRGFHPFRPIQPDIGDGIPWQDWILSDDVLMDNTSNNYFNRDSPPHNGESNAFGQPRVLFQPGTTTTGGGSSGGRTLALNDNVIADILAATRELPSWKACQMEGMGWSGTAEENIQKYVSTFDVQGP